MRFLTPWKKISFLEEKTYKTDTYLSKETVQYFLYDKALKPHLHLGEIFAIYVNIFFYSTFFYPGMLLSLKYNFGAYEIRKTKCKSD